MRNKRLKLNKLSVVGMLVNERSPLAGITIQDLAQVDLLLHFRPYCPERGRFVEWYPRCIGYGRGTFDLFARATNEAGLAPLKTLLKVADRDQLRECLREFHQRTPLHQRLFVTGVRFGDLLNVSKLAT